MTKELQHRRGTSAEHAAFKGAPGEITVDTNKFVAVVHDNQTFGGHELVGVAATQTVRNKTIIAGSGTTTGTTSQPLQVTGGAYVSGNLGVGNTNPSRTLTVAGSGTSTSQLFVAGISTFSGNLLPSSSSINIGGVLNPFGVGYWSDGGHYYGINKIFNSDGSGFGLWAYSSNAAYLRSNAGGGSAGDVYIDTTLGGKVIAYGAGSVQILHSQNTKFETVSAGVTVTGTTFTNQLSVSGVSTFFGNVGIGSTIPASALDVTGEITSGRVNTTQEGGQINFKRATDNAVAYSIDCYNDVGLGLTPRLRFIDNVSSAERMSIDRAGNILVGSGTSTGTAGQLLQVNSGAYFGANVGISSTNPDAELVVVGPGTSVAGSAPVKVSVASTFLLATPEAGAFEYDRVLLYHTNHDTTNANKRALIPEVQFIRRAGDVSITAVASPGTSFFGATNRPALLGGYIYEIEAVVFITKVTNNGTVTLQAALSTGNFTFATLQGSTAATAVVVGGTTSPVSIFTSTTLTAGVSYGFTIKGLVQPASNSRFDLLLFSSLTSTTALANSYLKVTCVGTGGPIGNFA